MIKEHLKELSGRGGKTVSGAAPGADKEKGSTTSATAGTDPLDKLKPKSVPGHLAQLKQHAGEMVAKGGSSQAGSVGPYLGE